METVGWVFWSRNVKTRHQVEYRQTTSYRSICFNRRFFPICRRYMMSSLSFLS